MIPQQQKWLKQLDEYLKGDQALRQILLKVKMRQPLENYGEWIPLVSESFTIDDDDVIYIDNGSNLPCSQMFELKPEVTTEENAPMLEEYSIVDEGEISDQTT